MNVFETWKEKSKLRKEKEVRKLAHSYITLTDFGGSIYIAYMDNPLMSVDSCSSAKDILEKLDSVRETYINSKFQNLWSCSICR